MNNNGPIIKMLQMIFQIKMEIIIFKVKLK